MYGFLEAPPGFEPGVKALQASALPLGYSAVYINLVIGKIKDALKSVFMERKTRFELATFTLAR